MSADTRIEDDLTSVGATLRREPSARREIMRRVTEASATGAAAAPASGGGRLIGRVLALAACAALVTGLLWVTLGGSGGGLGPQAAYAAAVEQVQKARSFSARKLSSSVDKDGTPRRFEMVVMFREPNLERYEYVASAPEAVTPEVTIRDYNKRQQLQLFPKDKTAAASDLLSLFTVEDRTGELKLAQLETTSLDEVRKLSARAAEDRGTEKLDGQDVRVLRSTGSAEPVTTVWANPKTNKPMKIELLWPSVGATYTYADIRIDENLDDALFSLDPPAGYVTLAPPGDAKPPSAPAAAAMETHFKMLSKMKYLVMECYKYQSKTKGAFPTQLSDLEAAGVTSGPKLRTMLAAPDQADGAPVVLYRKPREGKDSGTEIVVYEAPEFRRDGKVVVGMWDGHSEILDEARFNELMK